MSDKKPNYYEVLGVSENATDQELKSSYRKLALQWHPVRIINIRIKTKIKNKKLKRNLNLFQRLIQFFQIRKKGSNMILKGKMGSKWEMEQEETSVDSVEDLI